MNKLPSNWQVKDLGVVAQVRSGFAFKSEDYLERGVKLVRIGNLNGSGLEFGDETVYVHEKYLNICDEFSLKENNVLIAMSGATTGKLAFVKQEDLPCLLNQRVGLISISNHQELNAKYLFYYLAKGDFKKHIMKLAGGSAQPNISPTQIMSLKIPLPPLPIQKQIAEILEKADKAKQKRKEANKLTDEFLQSVFIEMFGDPVKNPKVWEVKNGRELFEYSSGKFNPTSNLNHSYPFPVYGGNGITGYSKNFLLDFQTLVIGRVGAYCGSVHITEEKCWITDNAIYIKSFKKAVSIKFIYFLLSYLNINRFASYSGQPKITQEPLNTMQLIFPPLSLQQQFAEIVNKVEALKEKQKQSEQELENLFQSLMQKAFNGELM